MVRRVSAPSRDSIASFTCWAVMVLPARSRAPSATITMLWRRPAPRPATRVWHIASSQSSTSGGFSGISTQLAPVATPDISAR